MKLYIEGFHGPWGWVDDFYKYVNGGSFGVNCVNTPEESDVIFQCDPQNWKHNVQFIGKKKVISNILDYAHWVNWGDCGKDIEEYSEEFVKKTDISCGISKDVINRMVRRGIENPRIFYYPSQISKIDCEYKFKTRKKTFISVGRFGDPGKRIGFSIDAFGRSKLSNDGWRYILIGPEHPQLDLPHGVTYIGYVERDSLINMIKNSHCVIQPEPETGLGLASIESALLLTPFLAVDNPPISDIWESCKEFLFEDSELVDKLISISKDVDQNIVNAANISAQPWLRESAFNSLLELVKL